MCYFSGRLLDLCCSSNCIGLESLVLDSIFFIDSVGIPNVKFWTCYYIDWYWVCLLNASIPTLHCPSFNFMVGFIDSLVICYVGAINWGEIIGRFKESAPWCLINKRSAHYQMPINMNRADTLAAVDWIWFAVWNESRQWNRIFKLSVRVMMTNSQSRIVWSSKQGSALATSLNIWRQLQRRNVNIWLSFETVEK